MDQTTDNRVLAGGGQMGQFLRARDWRDSPLGPPQQWPASLRTAIRIVLDSRHPMFLWWGPHLLNFYNDAYAPILGKRHPDALGRPARETWADIWHDIGPQVDAVVQRGEATWNDQLLLVMERNGYPEETYFTFSYSPAPDDDGGIGGLFCACTEQTEQVLGSRRLRLLRLLAAATAEQRTEQGVCDHAADTLAKYREDVPFALIYLLAAPGEAERAEGAKGRKMPGALCLCAATGLEPGSAVAPLLVTDETKWTFGMPPWDRPAERHGLRLAVGPWPEPAHSAVRLPLVRSGQERPLGYLVAGVSPRLPYDRRYAEFLELLANSIASALATAQSYEEERRLLGELETQRARLADVFRRSPSFMAVLRGPEHVFELVNERYYELVGHRPLIGRPAREALPEVEGQGFFELLDHVYQTGKLFVGQDVAVALQRTADGPLERRRVEFVYQPMRDAEGNVTGMFVHGVDLTQHKLTEAALRESEERLLQAVAIAQMGTFNLDLRSSALTVNESGKAITGWPPEQVLTFEQVQAQFHPEDRAWVTQTIQQAMAADGPGGFEVEHRLFRISDGALRWVRVRGRAVHEQQGEERIPIRCVGTFLDITEQKEAERRREQLLAAEQLARAEAERASRLKDEFLATLSHELRTPLAPVLLTVSMLESHPALPPELREEVDSIRRNVELEAQLIADLLDLTRISKGMLQLEAQEVDLHAVARSAIDICQRDGSAQLLVDLSARCPFVRGDPTRLQQIFWNLISNAQKFTGPGGMIRIASRDLPDGRIGVSVTDTGVGIDAAVLPRLFSAFEQGEVRASRQQAGLGLGLAISRRLAEAHGGTVRAESPGRGKGSTFTVELPAIAPAPRHRPEPEAVAAAGGDGRATPLHVLLIEDHEPTLRIMTRLLRRLGHDVAPAASVSAALEAARHRSFDLVISDLGLPDGSGLDVMRRLRAHHVGPAIALSGYGMQSDVDASHDAGFTEHLIKPINLRQLEDAIRRVTAEGAMEGE